MSFNFPDAPIVGQVFPPYEWDGEKWVMQVKPGKGDALVTVGDTPPAAPIDRQFWWNSTTGVLYFRFNDGSSSQWVVATAVPDISTLTSKIYVDAADAAAKAYTDAADAAAKTYTDTGDAASKTYTDAKDAAARTYTDTGDATMKAYADTADALLFAATQNTVKYTTQSLTSPQQAVARANINATPVPSKQYIVNGSMQVSAENGATAGTTTGYHPVDQFWAEIGGSGAWSIQQVASPTPGGSPNRIRLTVTTASVVAAGDYGAITQFVEGSRCFDLRFGTTSAKAITLRWGCRAPSGTYSMVVLNADMTRSFVSDVVIAAGEANTDVVRIITVPGDQAGTWPTGNVRGFYLRWCVRTGSSYMQAPGTWGTTNTVGSPNQFNFFGSPGNVFELFDVAMYEGSAAPNYVCPELATEKWQCLRYFRYETYIPGGHWLHPIDLTPTPYRRSFYQFQPEMCRAPAVTLTGATTGTAFAAGHPQAMSITPYSCEPQGDATSNTGYSYLTSLKANARLL